MPTERRPRRIALRFALTAASLLLAAASVADAQTTRDSQSADWPGWRGAAHVGLAERTKFPEAWPQSAPAPLWQAATAEGWSSPIVADGKVFVTDRHDAAERVRAFEAATGKLLWERTNPVDFAPHAVGRRHGNGPKATPAYSAGRVYSLGIAGWLQCLNAEDGALFWKRHLPAEFGELRPLPDNRMYVDGEDCVVVPVSPGQGAPVPLFGYTGSPIVVDDLLITPVGGTRGGTIMAFDKGTGAVVWKALDENVSYSSPIVAAPAGKRQVIVATGPRLVGLDVASGKLLWSVPYQNQYDETIGTPVVAGDYVLLTAVGRPLTAWRISAHGDGFTATEAWRSEDMSSYLSSVVSAGDLVFGMNDGGEWNCANLRDGRLLWRGGNHGYYCTPVLVDRRILALNEQGELAVLAADGGRFQQLALHKLTSEATWTSPAVAGNRLYVRSRSQLSCYEFK